MAGSSVGAVYVDAIINNKGFSKQVDSTVKGAEKSFSGAFGRIGKVIGAALSVAAVVEFGKACVQAAMQAESAFMGLNSQLSAQGKSFSQAKKFLEEYTADGLVPMTNAANAYKQLAARGFSSEQIKDMMNATKDMAAYNRQSHYSMGEAVEVFAQGLKNEESTLTDAAGMTKNLSVIWDEYAKTIGKTGATLTQTEKVQAEYLATMNEWQYSMGNAAAMSDTFQGRLTKLKATFSSIKTEIGNILIPILDLFIPVIQKAADAVLRFVKRIKELLAIFGLKMKEIGGGSGAAGSIASGMDSAAESAGAAADAIGSTGDAATAAAKAVKRALAPYDELNRLTFAQDSKGSSGGGGGGSDSGLDEDTAVEVVEEGENALAKLSATAEKYLGIFTDAFKRAFGDTNFDAIKAHIAGIGEKIKEVFGDPEVTGAAEGFVEAVVNFFGTTTGAVARLGVNLAEWLLGSIDYALEVIKEDLKDRFVRLFDGWADAFDAGAGIMQVIGEISDVFKSNEAKRLGGELLACLTIPAGLVVQFVTDMVSGLLGGIEKALDDNKGAIKIAITDLFDFSGDLVQPIREMFQGVANKYDEVYKEHLKPAFDKFGKGWSDFIGGFMEVWNKKAKPLLDDISEGWEEFAKGSFGKFLEELVETFGKLVGSIGDLFAALGGILGAGTGEAAIGLLEALAAVLDAVFKVATAVVDVGSGALEMIGAIFEMISGTVELFTTGDVSKGNEAMGDFVEGFLNIVDAILKLANVDFDLSEWFAQFRPAVEEMMNTFGNTFWDYMLNPEKLKDVDWKAIGETIGDLFSDAVAQYIEWQEVVKEWFADLWDAIKNWFKEKFANSKPLFTADAVSKAVLDKDSIKTEAANIGKNLWDGIVEGWNERIGQVKDFVSGFVGKIKENLGIHSPSTVFADIGKWCVEGLKQGLLKAKDSIVGAWNTVKSWFSDIKKKASVSITQKWNDIKNSWNGLVNNIKDKTANMRAKVATTWGSIKNSWAGVVNNIKDKTASMKAKVGTTWSQLRGTWNSLIQNFKDKTVTVTLKLKSLVSDLKSWVNSNIISKINKALPIIKIPYLAQGGWLPANAPQLAVVGDNRREGEIVAPESKIREQVKQAIQEMGMGGNATIRLEIAMPDGRTIIKEINRAQMAAGKVLILS